METKTGFFDARAENWEETCYPPAVRERLGGLIHEFGVMPGERLLDVGTGPGVLLPYLRQCVGPSGHISALDLSYEMIRQACRKPRLSLDLFLQEILCDETLPYLLPNLLQLGVIGLDSCLRLLHL